MARKWSKQRVIEVLQTRHRQGHAMSTVWKDDATLYATAKRYFGSWRNAMQAAGLEVQRNRWTKESVIAAIQARQQQGLPLRNVDKTDSALTQAASRHFGGWAAALSAAGIDVSTGRIWTRQAVVKAIQASYQDGEPMRFASRDDRLLYVHVRKYFGSWSAAMQAAGLKSLRQRWSKQQVIDGIQEYVRQHSSIRGIWKSNGRLAAAASRFFATHDDALLAAGVPRSQLIIRQRWSRDRVLASLREWQRQGRAFSDIVQEDSSLYAAARRYFGSLSEALQQAQLIPVPKTWTRELVVAALQECSHSRPTLAALKQRQRGIGLAVKRYFRNWNNAFVAAGMENPYPQTKRRKWSEDRVIQSIQTWQADGRPVNHIWKEDKPLFLAAKRRFGTWCAALAAAGIESEPRKEWSEYRVIKEIQALGVFATMIRQSEHHALAGAAVRYFGSLERALLAAGLEPSRRSWTAERVIEAIQSRHVRGGDVD